MQQAIIERASFQRPSVTTFGQFAVTMTSRTSDDIDLYVRDPQGDIAWYGSLQAGALSLAHDQGPGGTPPRKAGGVRRQRAGLQRTRAGRRHRPALGLAGSAQADGAEPDLRRSGGRTAEDG